MPYRSGSVFRQNRSAASRYNGYVPNRRRTYKRRRTAYPTRRRTAYSRRRAAPSKRIRIGNTTSEPYQAPYSNHSEPLRPDPYSATLNNYSEPHHVGSALSRQVNPDRLSLHYNPAEYKKVVPQPSGNWFGYYEPGQPREWRRKTQNEYVTELPGYKSTLDNIGSYAGPAFKYAAGYAGRYLAGQGVRYGSSRFARGAVRAAKDMYSGPIKAFMSAITPYLGHGVTHSINEPSVEAIAAYQDGLYWGPQNNDVPLADLFGDEDEALELMEEEEDDAALMGLALAADVDELDDIDDGNWQTNDFF